MSTVTYNKKDVKRILRKNGWFIDRYNGSHIIYSNDNNEHLMITSRGCNKIIFQRLIKKYKLKV